MTTPWNVLLLGCGKMGKLHLRSLTEIARAGVAMNISVVDHDETARAAATAQLQGRGQVFADYREAARTNPPDILVMALNEDQHAAAFRHLLVDYPAIRAVFSEKPLLAHMSEAADIVPLLKDKLLTLNTVIHFSPVFDAFNKQKQGLEPLKPLGYEMLWWNDWVNDTRWTPGVVADLPHPLGIVGEMLGGGHLEFVQGHGISGLVNPPITPEPRIHTLHRTPWKAKHGIPALMTASYARRSKDRIVQAAYEGEGGTSYWARFQFDLRDEAGVFRDRLGIYQIPAHGPPRQIFNYVSSPEDIQTGFAPGVMTADKVAAFMGQSFRLLADPAYAMLPGRRADLAVSLRIQESIEAIATPGNPDLFIHEEDAADAQRRFDRYGESFSSTANTLPENPAQLDLRLRRGLLRLQAAQNRLT